MTFSIRYEDDGVVTTYSGNITGEDILNCAKERTSSKEKVQSFVYLISDFTQVKEFNVDSDSIQAIAQYAKEISHINDHLRVILIAPTDLEFGMARMWQIYSDNTNWQIEIFRSMQEARDWIIKNI